MSAKNGHYMVLGEEKQNIEIVYTKQYLFHLYQLIKKKYKNYMKILTKYYE